MRREGALILLVVELLAGLALARPSLAATEERARKPRPHRRAAGVPRPVVLPFPVDIDELAALCRAINDGDWTACGTGDMDWKPLVLPPQGTSARRVPAGKR